MKIELITGTILEGDFTHHGHKHPLDSEDFPERKNWHYYTDKKTGVIHHLRGTCIVRVTEEATDAE